MFKQMVFAIIIVAGFALSLAGCGNDNSGSLTLGSIASSNGVVTAEATYSPASGSALPNQKITFYWRTVGKTTGNAFDYPPVDSYTDSSGKALSVLTLPSPRTEAMTVYVKAATGDLITVLQSVDVEQ